LKSTRKLHGLGDKAATVPESEKSENAFQEKQPLNWNLSRNVHWKNRWVREHRSSEQSRLLLGPERRGDVTAEARAARVHNLQVVHHVPVFGFSSKE
jgi:hypothetical protein